MDMSLLGIVPTQLAFGPAMLVPASVAPVAAFSRRLVRARAVSDDGTCVVEFDVRTWLDQASDEDLLLLLEEWLLGDGPGCRRVLERHSKDTQAFLAYVQQQGLNWGLRIDARDARAWIATEKPYLVDSMDEDMIEG